MHQDETVAEAVSASLTEEHMLRLGETIGQSPAAVKRMLSKLVALVVNSLQERAARPNGVEALWTLTQQASAPGELSTLNLASGRGVKLMQGLLGDRYEQTLQQIAAGASLTPTSTDLLLEAAVATVLGKLQQRVTDHGLNDVGLSQWLQQQQPPVSAASLLQAEGVGAKPFPASAGPVMPDIPLPHSAAVPPTSEPGSAAEKDMFQRFTVAGAGTWEKVGGGITFTPGGAENTPRKSFQLPHWKWALLVLPMLLLSFLGVSRLLKKQSATATGSKSIASPQDSAAISGAASRADPVSTTTLQTPAGRYDPTTDTYIYHTGQPLVLTLPDGSRQRVGANSTEYQLYRFLADPAQRADPMSQTVGWMNVDRVYFMPGKATLTEESQQQLRNLASILKAFPRSYIKLGGHTDNTGDAVQNQLLSQERATAAMTALSGLGVASGRVLAEGYGSQMIVASNDAPVGRALNRRLSLQVISKSGPLLQPEEVVAVPPPAVAARRTNSAVQSRTRRARARQVRRVPRTKAGKWLHRVGQRIKGKRATD